MRLINTESFELHEFIGDQVPPYAILSHRWENEEVTFQDMKDRLGPIRKGWGKIVGCCAKARREGWKYIWIDTCCIDKSSSAELSESINSMFAWYRDARICYAYLSDVARSPPVEKMDSTEALKHFHLSRWFTRGWTLQELLAPEWMTFLAEDWSEIGTKSSLAAEISNITGISHLFNYQEASVGQKMSWASRRKTSRLEDMAYCLMGLFDVNMPLLYGEGNKALVRLQLEILAKSDDDTIFAWTDGAPGAKGERGLLTESIEEFKDAGRMVPDNYDSERPPQFMTNKGYQMQLFMQSVRDDLYIAHMNCAAKNEYNTTERLCLLLRGKGNVYYRFGAEFVSMNHWALATTRVDSKRTIVYVKQSGYHKSFENNTKPPTPSCVSFEIDLQGLADTSYYPSERTIWSRSFERSSLWHEHDSEMEHLLLALLCMPGIPLTAAMLQFKHKFLSSNFTIIIGLSDGRPWIAASTDNSGSLRTLEKSFDEQNWWPRSRDDSKMFRDRVKIELGSLTYINVGLFRVSRAADYAIKFEAGEYYQPRSVVESQN